MLKRFFKPKWQHTNADIRLQAVEKLDLTNTADHDVLMTLARGDESDEVRCAAIARIERLDTLLDLYSAGAASKEVKESIGDRLGAVLCKDETLQAEQHSAALSRVHDQRMLDYILEHGKQVELQCLALKYVEDLGLLERMAVEGRATSLRQLAAEKIDDPERLKRIEGSVKGRDKTVYRMVKEKLTEIRQKSEQRLAQMAEVTTIVDAARAHSLAPVEPLYENKWRLIEKRWQSLDEAQRESVADIWQGIVSVCEAKLAEWHSREEVYEGDAATQADAERLQQEAITVLGNALDLLTNETDFDTFQLEPIAVVLNEQTKRWKQSLATELPIRQVQEQFDRINDQLTQCVGAVRQFQKENKKINDLIGQAAKYKESGYADLAKLRKRFDRAVGQWEQWPTQLKQPKQLLELETQAKTIAQRLTELKASTNQTLDAVNKLVAECEQAVTEGSLANAQKVLNRLQDKVKQLPDDEAKRISGSVKCLAGQVYELRDWQGFAATPKKEALVEKMSALIDSDMDLGDRAKEIKALQEEWKTLGRAEPKSEQALWNAFKEAGDRAFEPCKAYFSGLDAQRSANLTARAELCEQLEYYEQNHKWSDADWKAVLETLKAAKQQWRDLSPVDQKQNKPVQKRFDQIIDKIQARLDGERDVNVRKKQKLIESVRALVDHEVLSEAIEKTQSLQKEWKTVGMVQPKQDQRLWKEFREACDQVFERRQKHRNEEQQERENNAALLEKHCETIETLLLESGEQIYAQRGEVKELKQETEAISPLPSNRAKELRNKFNTLYRSYESKISTIEEKQLEAGYHVMWQKALLCEHLEKMVLTNQLPDNALVDIKSEWAQLGEIPVSAEAAMNARFDAAIDMVGTDDLQPSLELAQANLTKARDLAIRIEILAGKDSPAEDNERRMSLQVDRLSSGLSGRSGQQDGADVPNERLEIEIAWCALGPVEPEGYTNYKQRFAQARVSLMS